MGIVLWIHCVRAKSTLGSFSIISGHIWRSFPVEAVAPFSLVVRHRDLLFVRGMCLSFMATSELLRVTLGAFNIRASLEQCAVPLPALTRVLPAHGKHRVPSCRVMSQQVLCVPLACLLCPSKLRSLLGILPEPRAPVARRQPARLLLLFQGMPTLSIDFILILTRAVLKSSLSERHSLVWELAGEGRIVSPGTRLMPGQCHRGWCQLGHQGTRQIHAECPDHFPPCSSAQVQGQA